MNERKRKQNEKKKNRRIIRNSNRQEKGRETAK